MKTFLLLASLVALLCFGFPASVDAAKLADVFKLRTALKGAAVTQFDSAAGASIGNYRVFLKNTGADSADAAKRIQAFRDHIAEVRATDDAFKVTSLLLFMDYLAQYKNLLLVIKQIDTLDATLQRQNIAKK